MARLWSSGFELNSTTASVEWTTATGTIQATTIRTGGFAGAVTSATSGTFKGFTYSYVAADTAGPNWFRFYLNITTNPNADTTIAGIQGGSGFENLSLVLTTTGTLKLFTQDRAVQIGSASSALSTARWYRIEMKMDSSPATGSKVGELQIDGVVAATSSTLTSTNMTGGASTINLGVNLEGETCTTLNINFDDVALNDNTGSFQNTYPGAGQIVHLKPNATGDNNTFTVAVGGTAGAANNFTRVNEVPPDDATSYNGAVLSGNIDDFNIDDTPGSVGPNDTINVVAVGVRYRAVVAAAEAAFKTRVKKAAAGTVSSSAAITPNSTTWKTNANAVPTNYGLTLYQDPDGINWTKATLDTSQVGYTISTTNTNAADISNVWILVDSTPAPPVAATYAMSVKIANRFVGPMALRHNFRQPISSPGDPVFPFVSAPVGQVAANIIVSGGIQTSSSSQNVSTTSMAAVVTVVSGTQVITAVQNSTVAQSAAVLTATGGSQSTAAIQDSSIVQLSATIMASGGLPTIATVNNVSSPQSAASVVAMGGSQNILTVQDAAISQSAATITASGGTQTISAGSIVDASVVQSTASIIASGGNQTITTIQDSSIGQSDATITATGGAQGSTSVQITSSSQSSASVIATGGSQNIKTVRDYSLTQVGATVTATGGTQSITPVTIVAIPQSSASVVATGGAQSLLAMKRVNIIQSVATVTVYGGTQTPLGIVITSASILQIHATVIANGGATTVTTPIPVRTEPVYINQNDEDTYLEQDTHRVYLSQGESALSLGVQDNAVVLEQTDESVYLR